MDETDVPTQRAQARQDARVPQADVDQGRTGGHPGPPGEGAPAPVGVTDRPAARPGVGRRAVPSRPSPTSGAARARGRSGPLSVSFVARPGWDRPEVAYAVSRKVGNAVPAQPAPAPAPGHRGRRAPDLPVGAYHGAEHRGGPTLDFDELKVAMSRALDKATSRAPGPDGPMSATAVSDRRRTPWSGDAWHDRVGGPRQPARRRRHPPPGAPRPRRPRLPAGPRPGGRPAAGISRAAPSTPSRPIDSHGARPRVLARRPTHLAAAAPGAATASIPCLNGAPHELTHPRHRQDLPADPEVHRRDPGLLLRPDPELPGRRRTADHRGHGRRSRR